MSEENVKRKAPTARVIAANLILVLLDQAYGQTTENLTDMFKSQVNNKKRGKVIEHFDKLTKKFIERQRKIVTKYLNPPVRDPAKVKAASERMKKTRANMQESA